MADDLTLALRLVGAVLDDCPDSTSLAIEAAGDVRVLLRLASLVVGLLPGETSAEKQAALTTVTLVLQLQPSSTRKQG